MAEDISYDKNIFARNLTRLMYQNRERQVEIANLLDVSKSTVSAYCKGAQMPRMDKLEKLANHFGVTMAELIMDVPPASAPTVEYQRAPGRVSVLSAPRASYPDKTPSESEEICASLNAAGQHEFLRYGRYLATLEEFKATEKISALTYIKHYIVPAAAGYASPIEGEDYELVPRTDDTPSSADFCISIQGDSMEPYIPNGSLVYVQRDAPLREFDAGIFFVDGDVFCKQWCVDYAGTLHLLSANPLRQNANITIKRDSGRSCICFGKVLLPHRLPQPSYY